MAKKPEKNENKGDKSGFLAAAKQGAKQWEKSREVEPREGGGYEVLPQGVYQAKITGVTLGTKEVQQKNGRTTTKVKVPQVQIKFMVTSGDHKGSPISMFQQLNNEVGWNIVSETVQKLGKETTGTTINELAEALEEIGEEKPACKIFVKKSVDAGGTERNNVYVNSLLQNDESPEDDDEDEDGDNEEVTLEKGMKVTHDEFGECTITKIIEDGDDVLLVLKDEDGGLHKGIDASEVTPVEDE